jgi:phosphatidylinositol-3-phosphatase
MRGGTTSGGFMPRAAAALVLAGIMLLGATATAGAASAPARCGTRTGVAPKTYKHVIVIMDENKSSSDVIGGAGSAARRAAPYLNHLATVCGLATNYHSSTHPSHPNYMAITGGVATDSPSVNAPNILQQVQSHGGRWGVYQGSMPSNCARHSSFPYKPQHNPGVAYTGLAGKCPSWDKNLDGLRHDIAGPGLPRYAFIAPDQCKDMEIACTSGANAITVGDNWLRTWIPKLLNTQGYRSGHTAIFITFDEGSHGGGNSNGEDCQAPANRGDISCHVATVLLSPWISKGKRSSTYFDHYSLLQTTERMLGLTTFVGHARDAATKGMRSAFGF